MPIGALRHFVTLDTPNDSPASRATSEPDTRYRDRVIADGASHYWRLGEQSGTVALDIIGGATGTISGGVTLAQAGALADGDTAMGFDGTTGKIVTAATVSIPLLCTIELWAKHGGFDQGALLNWGNEAPVFSVQAGGKVILYDTNNANVYAETASLLGEQTWYALTFVLNGTTALLYRNGVLDSTLSFVRTIPNAVVLSIGYDTAYGVDQAGFWLGSLDEVAIYPRALTAPEIAAHYEAAQPLPPPTTINTWWCASIGDPSGAATFIGRYRSDINTSTRVLFKGRRFHVDAIVNREDRDRELVLQCREVFE